MSAAFDEAFEALMEEEGGYVFHPSDPGGETKYGITKRSYPDLDIKNLTLAQAKAIYRRDFWPAEYDSLSPEVVSVLFEFGVNAGKSRAVRALQQAINSMPYIVEGVTEDGILGPQTRSRIREVEARGPIAEYWLADRLRLQQASYYTELAAKNKKFMVFLVGWLRRAIR